MGDDRHDAGALTLHSSSMSQQPLPNRPVAIALGHEGDGLTDDASKACTHRARIAMADGVDSVNVATAAAIALYECS